MLTMKETLFCKVTLNTTFTTEITKTEDDGIC